MYIPPINNALVFSGHAGLGQIYFMHNRDVCTVYNLSYTDTTPLIHNVPGVLILQISLFNVNTFRDDTGYVRSVISPGDLSENIKKIQHAYKDNTYIINISKINDYIKVYNKDYIPQSNEDDIPQSDEDNIPQSDKDKFLQAVRNALQGIYEELQKQLEDNKVTLEDFYKKKISRNISGDYYNNTFILHYFRNDIIGQFGISKNGHEKIEPLEIGNKLRLRLRVAFKMVDQSTRVERDCTITEIYNNIGRRLESLRDKEDGLIHMDDIYPVLDKLNI